MIANDYPKVVLFVTDKELPGVKIKSSLGNMILMTYEDFNQVFKLSINYGIENFVTLDQDRFFLGHGPMFDGYPKDKRLIGLSEDTAFNQKFWVKNLDTNLYYGLS